MQYFEWYLKPDSTHWRKVKEEAKQIAADGVTGVWLPPAYKGASGAHDVGYAVYDLYDLGEFNQKGSIPTKYGTKDEYLEAVRALKAEGLEVLADIVLGHRMGADEQERIFAYGHDVYDRNNQIGEKRKIRVWTKFTFPNRNNKYSDFKWDWTNFHATDYDAQSKKNGVFKFIGKNWDDQVDGEFGNYDYLMGLDVDMSDPEVVEEMERWGKWYYEFTGVDGFRIDAVKHIKFGFFKDWLNYLRKETGKDIFAVGEYWNAELYILENYIKQTERTLTVFDVPLHFNLHHASKSNGYYDMRYILKNTLVSSDPEMAVTFVDNHDTQPGQALESWVLSWFKQHAYALIMLRKDGIPCAFYGDYKGIPHDNIEVVPHLSDIMKMRQTHNFGEMHDYFCHPKVVGWTREGDDEHADSGFAVLMTVEKGGFQKMYVGKHFAGHTFKDMLEHVEEEVKIDEEGFGIFEVKDGSISIYVKSDDKAVEERDTEEIFHDEREVGALDEVTDGTVPQLFFGSNYANEDADYDEMFLAGIRKHDEEIAEQADNQNGDGVTSGSENNSCNNDYNGNVNSDNVENDNVDNDNVGNASEDNQNNQW